MTVTSVPIVDRLAVIGLGLIGGSVAGAARRFGVARHVVGFSVGDDGAAALARGLLDESATSIGQAVAGADLIVIATPVTAFDLVFAAVAAAAPEQAIITDCASTKMSAVRSARAHLGAAFARFVPGHPIAGSERSGPHAARIDLFKARPWVFCPVDDSQRAHLPTVEAMAARFGANPTVVAAEEHDAMFAEYSHAPHALVFAVCLAVARGPWSGNLTELAGAGLRDTTRIGASSPTLWADILLDNAGHTITSLARFDTALDELRAALSAGDRDKLIELIAQASDWRVTLGAQTP